MTSSEFEQGNQCSEQGDFNQAIVFYKQALAGSFDDEYLHVNLGHAYLKSARFREGIEHLELHFPSRNSVAMPYEVLVNLGLLYHGSGDSDQALALLREASNNVSIRPEAYIGIAEVYSQQGTLDDVVEIFTNAQIECGRDAKLHNYIGSFYNDVVGDHRLATIHFFIAHKASPENAAILGNLGIAQVATGAYADAIESLSKAIKINAEYIPAYWNLAVALYNNGEYGRAVTLLDQVIRKFPAYAAENNLKAMRDDALEAAKS